jgi:hypothetical protein
VGRAATSPRGGGRSVDWPVTSQWESLPRHRSGGGSGLHSANSSQYFKIVFKIPQHDYFVVCKCCGFGVPVIYNNGLYQFFVYEVNILLYIVVLSL